jgi:hypothetical protein
LSFISAFSRIFSFTHKHICLLQIFFFIEDFGAVDLRLLAKPKIATKICAVANDAAKPNRVNNFCYDKFFARQKTWHDF